MRSGFLGQTEVGTFFFLALDSSQAASDNHVVNTVIQGSREQLFWSHMHPRICQVQPNIFIGWSNNTVGSTLNISTVKFIIISCCACCDLNEENNYLHLIPVKTLIYMICLETEFKCIIFFILYFFSVLFFIQHSCFLVYNL